VRRVIALMVLLPVLMLPGCKSREQRLMEEGNALIERIDSFQKTTQRLPENLGELGIEEKMEGPLYYQKVSAEHYMVYFGTTVGESMIYRSEKRAWADH
jgi:hypothetical protein